MAWKVSADPVDFDEAIAWFRKRVPVTKAEFERLSASAKRKAFTVANVAQLDLVHQAWKALDKAEKDGTDLADFKKTIGEQLQKAWGEDVDDAAWRLETIFRTNLQLAYGAGRYKQATHPDIASDRPVWMFDAILDGRTTEVCTACDGTKRPSDDGWWRLHTPPLHFNCRSTFIALTEGEAGKVTLHPPAEKADDGFGLAPDESEWEPDPKPYPQQLAAPFEKKQAVAPPPPPPAKLVAGTHVKALSTGKVAKPTVDKLLSSISDAETLRFLEATPLEQLSLTKSSKVGTKKVNGWYLWTKRQLEVSADRDASSFGQAFEAGVTWSISSSQTTKEAAAKATLRHELGHHIHLFDGYGTKVDGIIEAAYDRAEAAGRFITKYASANDKEYFSESYAAYYLRRSDLKAHDPNGYKMVEDVLKERGILP